MENSPFLPDRGQLPALTSRIPAFRPESDHVAQSYLPFGMRPANSEERSLFLEYCEMLRRRWKIVAVAGATGAVAGLVVTFFMMPIYSARTSLDIQALNQSYMNMHAADPNGQSGADSMESYIQTQIKLLQSNSVVGRAQKDVKGNLNKQLARISGARETENADWLSFFAPQVPAGPALVEDAVKRLKVRPLGATRLVEATCESPDPQMAADFCNSLTNAFIQSNLESRWDAAQSTGEWLSKQLEDLRAKLGNSELELQRNAQSTTLLYSQGRESVGQERLRQLQEELSRAQADRMIKQAQFETSRSVNPDSQASVIDSGALKDLQLRLADLRRQLADLSSLTANHPRVKRVQAQISELEELMKKERGAVLARGNNEFTVAREREKLLTKAYQQQEAIVSTQLGMAARDQMLKREVDSDRQLYETMLQRVKEAGFATAMRSSSIHIIDPALRPKFPVSPRRLSNVLSGLAFGAVLGLGLVFFKERTEHSLRVPGDIVNTLRVRELGIIPSARFDRAMFPSKFSRLLGRNVNAMPTELVTIKNDASLLADSYRAAMNSLLFSGGRLHHGQVFVISSPVAKEGKTTVVSNLGLALAEARRRVILVDGDMRQPRLHTIFELDNSFGLRNILAGEVDIANCEIEKLARPTFVPGLFVLPAGTSSEKISGLLHSAHMATLMARLRKEFEVSLIDTPPLLHLSDARLIGNLADGVVLVVRSSMTTADSARTTQNILLQDHTRIVGAILNDFNPRRNARAGYYKTYYKYASQA